MKYLLTFLILCCLSGESICQVVVTKLFIVRHADRQPGDDLNALGVTRAEELKRVLQLSAIDSIFSTNFVRTKKTVQPLATLRGLPVILYSTEAEVITRALSKSQGKRVLIAGHSDTVAELIRKCGCKPYAAIDPIPSTQFDNLFLVLVKKTSKSPLEKPTCELIHMKYGAVTR